MAALEARQSTVVIDDVPEKRPTRQRKAIEPFTYASIGETGSGMKGKSKEWPRPKPGACVESSSAKKAAAPRRRGDLFSPTFYTYTVWD